MNIKPLYGRVVIELKSDEEITKSGIVIPDTADKEKPQEGTIISVADWRLEDGKQKPMSLKKGDKVLYPKYGGDEVKIDDQVYVIIEEEKVLATIK
jgi:chaperonin GroES